MAKKNENLNAVATIGSLLEEVSKHTKVTKKFIKEVKNNSQIDADSDARLGCILESYQEGDYNNDPKLFLEHLKERYADEMNGVEENIEDVAVEEVVKKLTKKQKKNLEKLQGQMIEGSKHGLKKDEPVEVEKATDKPKVDKTPKKAKKVKKVKAYYVYLQIIDDEGEVVDRVLKGKFGHREYANIFLEALGTEESYEIRRRKLSKRDSNDFGIER